MTIDSALQSLVLVLAGSLLVLVWAGWRMVRGSGGLRFYSLRRQRQTTGWQLIAVGVIVGLVQRLVLRGRTRDALASALTITVVSALLCSVSAGGPAQVEGPFMTSLRTGLAGGVVGGGFVALCQHLILRRRLTAASGWVLVTLVAWTVGWACGWIAVDISFAVLSSAQYVRGLPLTAVGMPLAVATGVMAGALVGLAQWVILRHHVKRAGWWIAATAASWGLAFVSIASGVGLMYRGVIVGGITGAALVWLTSPRAAFTTSSAPDSPLDPLTG